MGIRIETKMVAFESITMEAINPEYLGITKEKLDEYVKEHPYPDDPIYPLTFMLGDVTSSSGFYTLPMDIKEETKDWICDMLNELV